MLKDAALLHLALMRDALDEDFILKDSSPYNVQWRGAQPVFIDIPSFEPLGTGEPWVGYRQFCELMLYPLMLQAYRGVDFRPWLRGRIDGIPAEQMRRLLSRRDLLRPGVLLHVMAQRPAAAPLRGQRPQRARHAGRRRLRQGPDREERREADPPRARPRAAGVRDRMVRLRPDPLLRRGRARGARPPSSSAPPPPGAGASPGTSAATPAPSRGSSNRTPTASWRWTPTGWRSSASTRASAPTRRPAPSCRSSSTSPTPRRARAGAAPSARISPSRGRPDLTLCLALVHHVVITANIPLADFIDWLAGLGTSVVIEFVGREDEMVQALLANREDQYGDYTLESFRSPARQPLPASATRRR